MTFRLPRPVLIALLFFTTIPHIRADEFSDLKKNMVAEWQSLFQTVKSMRRENHRERHRSIKGKPMRLFRRENIKYAFSPNGSVFNYDTEYYDEEMKVRQEHPEMRLVNQDYKAELRKPAGKKSWVLTDLIQPPPEEKTDRRLLICPWLLCGNIILPDWIADDRFVITRIEKLTSGQVPGAIRVHFKHDESRKKAGAKPLDHDVHAGYIDFDPNRHYCVLGYRYERHSQFHDSIETGIFDYGGEVKGIPVLEKITEEVPIFKSEKFGSQRSRTEWTYKLDYDSYVPEEEFRLSHYGLPEPMGVTWKKPTPMYIWFLLAAGVVALLAVAFRFLARRTAKKPA